MSDAPRRQERAVSKLMPTALRCDDMTRCTECDFDYESANGEDFARLAGPFVDSYVELLRSNNLAACNYGLRRMGGRRWSMPATFVICCWCSANGCWPRVAEIGPLRSRWDVTRGWSTTDTTTSDQVMLRVSSQTPRCCYQTLSPDCRPPTGSAPWSIPTPSEQSVPWAGSLRILSMSSVITCSMSADSSTV